MSVNLLSVKPMSNSVSDSASSDKLAKTPKKEVLYQVKVHDRKKLGGPYYYTVNCNSLSALVEFLSRFIPDESGWVGDYLEDDIMEIKKA